MASLSPKLTATPGTPPTYNVGMAETFSWIPVQGAERPIYARATYLTNPEDIKVSLSAGDVTISTAALEGLISTSNTMVGQLTANTDNLESLIASSNTLLAVLTGKTSTLDVTDLQTRLDVLTAIDYSTSSKQDGIISLLNALTAKETTINLDVSAINLNTDEVEELIGNTNTLLNALTAKVTTTDVSGIEFKLDALTAIPFATYTNQQTTNTLLESLTALQENKQDQIITLLHSVTGMSFDVDLTTDQINLDVDQVETLLNDLTATNIKVPGFSIPPYDEISLSYYGTTNNLSNVSYLNNSTTVLSLSFAYASNPPTTNDALLVNVKKV